MEESKAEKVIILTGFGVSTLFMIAGVKLAQDIPYSPEAVTLYYTGVLGIMVTMISMIYLGRIT